MVPAPLRAVVPGPRFRRRPVDARPAAPLRRRAHGVPGQPAHRGQPPQLPPRGLPPLRPQRLALAHLGAPLDRRGGPARHRAARLPHRHAQPRPGRPRAPPHGAHRARLRLGRQGLPARHGLRVVPGAGHPRRAPQHRPLLRGPGRRPDHGPHLGRREPPHGLLPRRPAGGPGGLPVRGGDRDRRRGDGLPDARRRHGGLRPDGAGDRGGRHLRPARPPRRRALAAAAQVGRVRARGAVSRGRAAPPGPRRSSWAAWTAWPPAWSPSASPRATRSACPRSAELLLCVGNSCPPAGPRRRRQRRLLSSWGCPARSAGRAAAWRARGRPTR